MSAGRTAALRHHVLGRYGNVTTVAGVTPMADRLFDSSGINVHFSFGGSVYSISNTNMQNVVDKILAAGWRVWRDKGITGSSTAGNNQTFAAPKLAAGGCRWHATIFSMDDASGWPSAPLTDAAKRTQFRGKADGFMNELLTVKLPALRAISGHGTDTLLDLMHSLAGPNEINGSYYSADGAGSTTANGVKVQDPYWPEDARLMSEAVYNAARVDMTAFSNTVLNWSAWVAAKGNQITVYSCSARDDFGLGASGHPLTEPNTLGYTSGTGDSSVNLNTACDWGNPHDYQNVSPGPDLDQMIVKWHQCLDEPVNATKNTAGKTVRSGHLMWSECGYHTGPFTSYSFNQPEDVHALYSSRLLLEMFQRPNDPTQGPPHVMCQYELANQTGPLNWSSQTTVNNTALGEHPNWLGFYRLQDSTATDAANPASTWVAKQALTAHKNIFTLMGDPGAAFTTADLPGLSVAFKSGTTGDANPPTWGVFQKRDGTWWILLYRNLDVWNNFNRTTAAQGSYITSPARTVTVSFTGAAKPIKVYCPRLSTAIQQSTASANTLDISMSGGIVDTSNLPWPIGAANGQWSQVDNGTGIYGWGIDQAAPCSVDTFLVKIG